VNGIIEEEIVVRAIRNKPVEINSEVINRTRQVHSGVKACTEEFFVKLKSCGPSKEEALSCLFVESDAVYCDSGTTVPRLDIKATCFVVN